ncbi:MAG: PIN domain-containing protein [Chloroflexi bacterium]|nr:PIN domain-containing protein [Chloroflexota bacterium]
MRVLIDTNIVLDVLLDRHPWVTDASQVWASCESGRITGYIPGSAMTDMFYVARRMTDIATAQIAVGLCLATADSSQPHFTSAGRAAVPGGHTPARSRSGAAG